jgi:hypothetical protein
MRRMAEPVEALFFIGAAQAEGQAFDKLRQAD